MERTEAIARPSTDGHPRTIVAQPLGTAAFAAFGTVLEVPTAGGRLINGGTTERFGVVPDLQLAAEGGRASLALYRAQARTFPHVVRELERHALGSQSFVPLGTGRFVVVVARAGDETPGDALSAFVTDGRQGVMLAPGTWHHALLAVDAGDFVVVERAAAVVDCDVTTIDVPLAVSLPA